MKSDGKMRPPAALLAALALAWALAPWGRAGDEAEKFDKMTVGDGVHSIEIETSGSVDIKLRPSADSLAVQGLKYENAGSYPVSASTRGGTVRLKIAGKKTGIFSARDTMRAEMVLLLPPGRAVRISGGLLRISGELSASDLELSGGTLLAEGLNINVPGKIRMSGGAMRLDASITGSSDIKLSGGTISGRLRAPCSARIDSGRSRPALKLYCDPEEK